MVRAPSYQGGILKITIESTTRVVEVQLHPGAAPVPGRIWEGETESGIPVTCLVTRVAVKNGHPTEQFERELQEQRPPSAEAIQAIPLRMIL